MLSSRMSVLLLLVVTLASSLAQKHFILFDVEDSSKTPEQIRDEMQDTDFSYFFKDLGSSKYQIVVEMTSSNLNKMRDVSLKGSVKSTPLVDMIDVGKELNVTWPRCGKVLPDNNLTLIERDLLLKGQTTAEGRANLKAYMEEMKEPLQKYNYRAFYSEARIPSKILMYLNLPLEEIPNIANKGIDQFGGPGAVNTTVRFIHNSPKPSQ